ncbi:histidine phosphatase family protein [Conchiformibius kuhniae]|uniref:Histidine phosphatase family protein n=1 Tax=Conchiformibius kuhniae TaxID=211502 RepID=A0A8T9MWL7_9NEIS|nr:histidine phosphatase family protein [Conchiformibius kuhniae]UOP04846.1 histidine phosphatase family protein [Conchiformibius kuhniae]
MKRDLDVYLVRHGQTEFNAALRLQGHADSPLTEAGREGARQLGDTLRRELPAPVFDAAFCSSLARTAATARIILSAAGQPDLPVTALADLREYGFGEFEGRDAAVLYRRLADELGIADTETLLHRYRHHPEHNLFARVLSRLQPQHSETEQAFTERLWRGMDAVAARSPERGRVLVVSHGMAIVALIKRLNPQAILYKSPPNAAVSRLHFDGTAWRIVAVAAPDNGTRP